MPDSLDPVMFCFLFPNILSIVSDTFDFFLLHQHAKHASVYLPGKELWYDVKTGAAYKGG